MSEVTARMSKKMVASLEAESEEDDDGFDLDEEINGFLEDLEDMPVNELMSEREDDDSHVVECCDSTSVPLSEQTVMSISELTQNILKTFQTKNIILNAKGSDEIEESRESPVPSPKSNLTAPGPDTVHVSVKESSSAISQCKDADSFAINRTEKSCATEKEASKNVVSTSKPFNISAMLSAETVKSISDLTKTFLKTLNAQKEPTNKTQENEEDIIKDQKIAPEPAVITISTSETDSSPAKPKSKKGRQKSPSPCELISPKQKDSLSTKDIVQHKDDSFPAKQKAKKGRQKSPSELLSLKEKDTSSTDTVEHKDDSYPAKQKAKKGQQRSPSELLSVKKQCSLSSEDTKGHKADSFPTKHKTKKVQQKSPSELLSLKENDTLSSKDTVEHKPDSSLAKLKAKNIRQKGPCELLSVKEQGSLSSKDIVEHKSDSPSAIQKAKKVQQKSPCELLSLKEKDSKGIVEPAAVPDDKQEEEIGSDLSDQETVIFPLRKDGDMCEDLSSGEILDEDEYQVYRSEKSEIALNDNQDVYSNISDDNFDFPKDELSPRKMKSQRPAKILIQYELEGNTVGKLGTSLSPKKQKKQKKKKMKKKKKNKPSDSEDSSANLLVKPDRKKKRKRLQSNSGSPRLRSSFSSSSLSLSSSSPEDPSFEDTFDIPVRKKRHLSSDGIGSLCYLSSAPKYNQRKLQELSGIEPSTKKKIKYKRKREEMAISCTESPPMYTANAVPPASHSNSICSSPARSNSTEQETQKPTIPSVIATTGPSAPPEDCEHQPRKVSRSVSLSSSTSQQTDKRNKIQSEQDPRSQVRSPERRKRSFSPGHKRKYPRYEFPRRRSRSISPGRRHHWRKARSPRRYRSRSRSRSSSRHRRRRSRSRSPRRHRRRYSPISSGSLSRSRSRSPARSKPVVAPLTAEEKELWIKKAEAAILQSIAPPNKDTPSEIAVASEKGASEEAKKESPPVSSSCEVVAVPEAVADTTAITTTTCEINAPSMPVTLPVPMPTMQVTEKVSVEYQQYAFQSNQAEQYPYTSFTSVQQTFYQAPSFPEAVPPQSQYYGPPCIQQPPPWNVTGYQQQPYQQQPYQQQNYGCGTTYGYQRPPVTYPPPYGYNLLPPPPPRPRPRFSYPPPVIGPPPPSVPPPCIPPPPPTSPPPLPPPPLPLGSPTKAKNEKNANLKYILPANKNDCPASTEASQDIKHDVKPLVVNSSVNVSSPEVKNDSTHHQCVQNEPLPHQIKPVVVNSAGNVSSPEVKNDPTHHQCLHTVPLPCSQQPVAQSPPNSSSLEESGNDKVKESAEGTAVSTEPSEAASSSQEIQNQAVSSPTKAGRPKITLNLLPRKASVGPPVLNNMVFNPLLRGLGSIQPLPVVIPNTLEGREWCCPHKRVHPVVNKPPPPSLGIKFSFYGALQQSVTASNPVTGQVTKIKQEQVEEVRIKEESQSDSQISKTEAPQTKQDSFPAVQEPNAIVPAKMNVKNDIKTESEPNTPQSTVLVAVKQKARTFLSSPTKESKIGQGHSSSGQSDKISSRVADSTGSVESEVVKTSEVNTTLCKGVVVVESERKNEENLVQNVGEPTSTSCLSEKKTESKTEENLVQKLDSRVVSENDNHTVHIPLARTSLEEETHGIRELSQPKIQVISDHPQLEKEPKSGKNEQDSVESLQSKSNDTLSKRCTQEKPSQPEPQVISDRSQVEKEPKSGKGQDLENVCSKSSATLSKQPKQEKPSQPETQVTSDHRQVEKESKKKVLESVECLQSKSKVTSMEQSKEPRNVNSEPSDDKNDTKKSLLSPKRSKKPPVLPADPSSRSLRSGTKHEDKRKRSEGDKQNKKYKSEELDVDSGSKCLVNNTDSKKTEQLKVTNAKGSVEAMGRTRRKELEDGESPASKTDKRRVLRSGSVKGKILSGPLTERLKWQMFSVTSSLALSSRCLIAQDKKLQMIPIVKSKKKCCMCVHCSADMRLPHTPLKVQHELPSKSDVEKDSPVSSVSIVDKPVTSSEGGESVSSSRLEPVVSSTNGCESVTNVKEADSVASSTKRLECAEEAVVTSSVENSSTNSSNKSYVISQEVKDTFIKHFREHFCRSTRDVSTQVQFSKYGLHGLVVSDDPLENIHCYTLNRMMEMLFSE